MSHPSPAGVRQQRLRRAVTPALAAALALSGLLVAGSTAANAADVAPSVRPIIKNANPSIDVAADEVTEGTWGSATNLGYTVDRVQNTTRTAADLKTLLCGPDADGSATALVPASGNPAERGSAERPKIAAGARPWEAFKWTSLVAGGLPKSPSELASGAVGNATAVQLDTRETVESRLDADASNDLQPVRMRVALPADTAISMVVYCTKGTAVVGGVTYQLPMTDADGYVVSTWLTFRTVTSPTNATYTGAGFKMVPDNAFAKVSLADQWSDDGVGTLTATLKSAADAALTDATGAVHFYQGAGAARKEVGSAPVTAAGTASLPLDGLVPSGGTAPFDAEYVPDTAAAAKYVTSTSSRYTVIAPTATTTTLSVTGSLVAGAAQTLTATVAPTGSNGTVTFRDGTAVLGTAPVAGGKAALSKALPVGAHSLTATYTPADVTYVRSASEAQSVTVEKAANGLSATASAGTYGRASTVTVTAASGATGAVTLSEGGRALGTGTLSGGSASIALAGTALTPGSHQLTVSYAGDASHVAGSAAVSLPVAKGSTSTTAKVATKKVIRKKTAAKLTVTVKASGFAPAGKVTVLLGKKKIGTATVKNGKATVKLKKFSKAGNAKLTVSFDGGTTGTASSKKLTVKVRSR